jgi:hypothetical protein
MPVGAPEDPEGLLVELAAGAEPAPDVVGRLEPDLCAHQS